MRVRQGWMALTVALGLLIAGTATGVPAPPQPPCNDDGDCPGCTRCTDQGWCGPVQTQPECMCNDECARAGKGYCDVSMVKARCGGQCQPGAPTRPLTCGAGDDFPKLGTVSLSTREIAPAVRVLDGTPLEIARSTGGTP